MHLLHYFATGKHGCNCMLRCDMRPAPILYTTYRQRELPEGTPQARRGNHFFIGWGEGGASRRPRSEICDVTTNRAIRQRGLDAQQGLCAAAQHEVWQPKPVKSVNRSAHAASKPIARWLDRGGSRPVPLGSRCPGRQPQVPKNRAERRQRRKRRRGDAHRCCPSPGQIPKHSLRSRRHALSLSRQHALR